MYVTSMHYTVAPFRRRFPEPYQVPLMRLDSIGITDAAYLAAYVQFLEGNDGTTVDWDSFEHDEGTRAGSVRLWVTFGDDGPRESVMSWGYEPLDDPECAESLPIPVDFHTEVAGALTLTQRLRFWGRVNPDLDPFEVLDTLLEHFGLEPTAHDTADLYAMRTVLALDWFRNFPTLEAGEATLDLEPDLTDEVLGALALMACRCALEGEHYELFNVFVAPSR